MAVFATGGCDRLALGGAKARLFWAMILPSYTPLQAQSAELASVGCPVGLMVGRRVMLCVVVRQV